MPAYLSRPTARIGQTTVFGQPCKGTPGWWRLGVPVDGTDVVADQVICQTAKDAQQWFDAQRVAGGR